jgi:hypothetical protein
MEDLKRIYWSWIKLDLFNIKEVDKIIEGLNVFGLQLVIQTAQLKWRQKFLIKSENVFPSILIIPSVDVD